MNVVAAVAVPRSLRSLVAVLSAMAAAWTSTRLLSIALPWFVLTTTGSAAATGLVVFSQMGPYVVVQVLAGPLIDRIGPRRISVVCDLTATVAMAAAPALYLMDALPLWALMALMAVVGAADGPANAAKSVFVPTATRAARVPLERATGLAGAIERTAGTAGPAIAGVMVAAFGGIYTLWITAAMFGLGAVIIALAVRDPLPDADEPETASTGGYFSQLRAGATFLRKDRLLRSIVGMVAVTNLIDQALIAVLLPVWAISSGHGPETVGLVVAVMSASSILASLLSAGIGHRMPRRAVYLIGFLVAGAPRFAILAFGVPLWAVIAVVAVAGFSSGFLNPIISAVQYERVPAAMLGRVRTMIHAVAWSGIPFGGLVGSAALALIGLSPALLVLGGCYLVVTLIPGMNKEWAQMNRSPSAPPSKQKQAVE